MGVLRAVAPPPAPGELGQDPPVGEIGAGVDQDVLDEVGVDRVTRFPGELKDVWGELFDPGRLGARRGCGVALPASRAAA
jgi:hypothetical protein